MTTEKHTAPSENGSNGHDNEFRDESGFNKLRPSLVLSSRWVGSSSDEKAVLTAMLALKDRNGFVSISIRGIAKAAEVTVDVARAYIEKLKSPDPDSRTKDYEGRTIEEVNGGFLFLNHFLHRDGKRRKTTEPETGSSNGTSPSPSPALDRGISNLTGQRQIRSDTDSRTSTIAVPPEVDGWHISERAEYEGLSAESHRKAFVIVRGFAEIAAGKEKPKFPIVQDYLARQIGCSQRNVSGILKMFCERGIIKRVEAKYRQAAIYRWTLESTIQIPPMPEEPEDDSDLGGTPPGRTANGNGIPF